jgi:hypothetical protein
LSCLYAAEAILKTKKYKYINILPTANGNNKGFDIEAEGENNKRLIGEVFCVSKKFFSGKKYKTVTNFLSVKHLIAQQFVCL